MVGSAVSVGKSSEKALSHYRKGYNSAQSILMAYADRIGLGVDVAIKTASAFGYGIGTTQSTCGVITGASMVLGSFYYSDDDILGSRQEIIKKTQVFINTFNKKFKAIDCLTLIGVDFHEPGGLNKVREGHKFENLCQELITYGCRILDKILSEE